MASIYDGSSLTVQPGPYYTITRDGKIAAAPDADPQAAFATDGEAAFYVKQPDGTYVQAVTRPVDSVDPSGRNIAHYDPSKQLWFNVDAQGKTAYESRALTNNEAPPTGGGLLHQNPVWNPSTGQYDQGGLDWSNIASLGVAGALGAGIAGAAAGSGAGAGTTASSAPVLEGTAAGPGAASVTSAGVLPSTTIGTGAVGPITGGAGTLGEIGTGAGTIGTGVGTGVDSATAIPSGAAASPASAAPVVSGSTSTGASLWSKLATSGIPVAGQIIGAAIQANAQGNATDAQAKAAADALAFEKDTLAKKQAALSPYSALGGIALQHLGLPASALPAPSVSVPTPAPGTSTQVQIPNYPNLATGSPPAPAPAQAQSIQQLGQSQTQSSLGPAQVGEQRVINGQPATWNGSGWLAQGAA